MGRNKSNLRKGIFCFAFLAFSFSAKAQDTLVASNKKPFEFGAFIVPTGLHGGLFLNYYFGSHFIVGISGSYKYNNIVLGYNSNDPIRYSGPTFQTRLGILLKDHHQGIHSLNFVYDFRYKMLDDYTVEDGRSYYVIREEVLSHNFLLILTNTFKLSHNFHWGFFVGGGIQNGHRVMVKTEPIYSPYSYEPKERKSSSVKRINNSGVFRIGIFVSYSAFSFGKRKNK